MFSLPANSAIGSKVDAGHVTGLAALAGAYLIFKSATALLR